MFIYVHYGSRGSKRDSVNSDLTCFSYYHFSPPMCFGWRGSGVSHQGVKGGGSTLLCPPMRSDTKGMVRFGSPPKRKMYHKPGHLVKSDFIFLDPLSITTYGLENWLSNGHLHGQALTSRGCEVQGS